jgi:hypothetical protein
MSGKRGTPSELKGINSFLGFCLPSEQEPPAGRNQAGLGTGGEPVEAVRWRATGRKRVCKRVKKPVVPVGVQGKVEKVAKLCIIRKMSLCGVF